MADIEKRIVKVCLSLAAVIILLAAFTLQTSAESYTFTDSNGISWSYKMSTYEGDSCAEITGCSSIPESGEITVPGYINCLPVIVGDNALNGVSGLIRATVSEGAIGLKGAFRGCDKLESVDLPSSLIFIDQLAFSQCTSLSSVDLKEGLKMIRGYAFGKCFSLTSVSIPSTVEVLEPLAFYECTSLSSIIIDGSNNSYKDIDGVLFNKDGDTLILYPLGRSDASYSIPDGVINIGNDAFARSQLEEIAIPACVRNIGDRAFDRSKSLKKVDIENGLENIGSYAFTTCTSLYSIKLPQTVNYIGSGCFNTCSALTRVTLPEGLSEIKTGTFKGTNIDQNFTIPAGVKCIEEQAFEYCPNLNHFIIPDSVERIKDKAFSDCRNLKDVYIASGAVVLDNDIFLMCGPYDTETGKRLFAICADQGSTAAEYASSAGIPFVSMTQEAYEAAIAADAPVYDPADDPADDPSGGNSGTGGNEETGSNGGNGNSGTGGGGTSGTASGSSGKSVMTGTASVPVSEKVKKTSRLGKPKFKAKNKKGRKVKLSWSKVKNADGYMIYVKGPKDKKFKRRVTKSARVKSITHKGLVKGKKYKYKIAAYKVVKGVKKRGPFSKTITVKIRK